MGRLWRFLRRLWQFRLEIGSCVASSSLPQITALESLPAEITQYLAQFFLDPSSAAALTLVSKRIAIAVGTQSWKACRENAIERRALIALLDRDLPTFIFCHDCDKLHKLRRPGLRRRECDKMEDRTRSSSRYHNYFTFMAVQLAMKRHRLGSDTRSLLAAMSRHTTYLTFLEPSHVSHLDVQVKIVAGELLVRVQDWRILPEIELVGRIKPLKYGWDHVCSHFDNYATQMVDCRYNHWYQNLECCICSGLKQCLYCHSECQLDVKKMGRYVAFVLTAWRNYGSGLTRSDPKWQAQSYRDSGKDWVRGQPRKTPCFFNAGSIKDGFEDGQAFCFESVLTPEVEADLHSRWLEGRDIRWLALWPPAEYWKSPSVIVPGPSVSLQSSI